MGIAGKPDGYAGFTVKSCGKAHAWCRECRPAQAPRQRKAKRPPKVHTKSCRDCGRCDQCLGIVAPEGMKVCRTCGETKPITAFAYRSDTGGRRTSCIKCRNATAAGPGNCVSCGAMFTRSSISRELCTKCRPELRVKCATCSTEFVTNMGQRRYCSIECREIRLTEQRAAAHARNRDAALRAYSTGPEPACACCGERIATFLALDHVEGGGPAQRQETGGGGFYTWLKKNGYPPGFRVLCHNCNHGREINGGVCPHDALVRELLEVP